MIDMIYNLNDCERINKDAEDSLRELENRLHVL